MAINYLEKLLEKKKKKRYYIQRKASNTVPLTPTARVYPPSYRSQRHQLPFFKRSYTPYFYAGAINYLEKEKKGTTFRGEHRTRYRGYKLLKNLRKKKKKKILHTEESIEHGTTDTKCESIPSKLSVTTLPIAVLITHTFRPWLQEFGQKHR